MAFNLYAVVMAVLRAAHAEVNIDESVSEYYLAAEIATTDTGLNIAVPEEDWTRFASETSEQLCATLLALARHIDFAKLRKTTRGVKKPPTPRTQFKGKSHVSTARLLAQQS